MKLLILGADGMLGHQLAASLGPRHDVTGTVRRARDSYRDIASFLPERLETDLEAGDFPAVERVLRRVRPDAVINAIGIVKQRAESKAAVASIELNALLPHRLALTCAELGIRLVHLSTDCVFSGRTGMYRESDVPDADDLYGRSKLLGEVSGPGCITLRTSIIGLELARRNSLIEWFLARRGPIRGFRQAIYSGFTTLEMARIIERVLLEHPDRHGMIHVSSEPIDKYRLLCLLRDRLRRDIEITPDDDFRCDRSLVSERFQQEFSYVPPSWGTMIDELAVQIEERYG